MFSASLLIYFHPVPWHMSCTSLSMLTVTSPDTSIPNKFSWNTMCFKTSLVVLCIRIRLPMQGTQVPSLVWEDVTCCGQLKPVCHNYWACALEPESHNYWSPSAKSPQTLQQEKPLQWGACAPQRRVVPLTKTRESLCNEDPARPKIN